MPGTSDEASDECSQQDESAEEGSGEEESDVEASGEEEGSADESGSVSVCSEALSHASDGAVGDRDPTAPLANGDLDIEGMANEIDANEIDANEIIDVEEDDEDDAFHMSRPAAALDSSGKRGDDDDDDGGISATEDDELSDEDDSMLIGSEDGGRRRESAQPFLHGSEEDDGDEDEDEDEDEGEDEENGDEFAGIEIGGASGEHADGWDDQHGMESGGAAVEEPLAARASLGTSAPSEDDDVYLTPLVDETLVEPSGGAQLTSSSPAEAGPFEVSSSSTPANVEHPMDEDGRDVTASGSSLPEHDISAAP